MKIRFLLCVMFAFILLSGCKEQTPKSKKITGNGKELKINKYDFDNPPEFRKDSELSFVNGNDSVLLKIDIEIASSEVEHARGLMFRKSMEENQGMLFMFEEEEFRSFWMHNTLIPLDIIYVNAAGKIVDVYKNTKTLSDVSLPSKYPAMYVVEINGGLYDKYGFDENTKIVF
ncbi:MAG: DUF192 domain-containing protein [Bacteroidales bacterium]|nr:DUF192 domain-containing protein [Bacteroidales bacterium]